MSPSVWIAPDAELTDRQQRVFEALCMRETGEFKSLLQCSSDLGDKSPMAIYGTLRVLERKGMVEEAPAPWGWRVRWLRRPSVYVRQGSREGWMLQSPPVECAVGVGA